MAKRMVTRTVVMTGGTAVAINIESLQPTEFSFQIPGEYKTPEQIMKKILPVEDGIKVIAVKNVEKKEVRYGMPEDEFIQNAQVLPPLPERTKETETVFATPQL